MKLLAELEISGVEIMVSMSALAVLETFSLFLVHQRRIGSLTKEQAAREFKVLANNLMEIYGCYLEAPKLDLI